MCLSKSSEGIQQIIVKAYINKSSLILIFHIQVFIHFAKGMLLLYYDFELRL